MLDLAPQRLAVLCYDAPMSDPLDETPMQRALRLKKAAAEAKPSRQGGFQRQQQAAMPPGKSKPWLKG